MNAFSAGRNLHIHTGEQRGLGKLFHFYLYSEQHRDNLIFILRYAGGRHNIQMKKKTKVKKKTINETLSLKVMRRCVIACSLRNAYVRASAWKKNPW